MCLLKDKTGLKFSDEDDPLLWNIFIESSYRVGFCMMELGKPQVAAYYLEIASKDKDYEHIQEYINCLSNLMDPQALDVVEEVLEHSPMPEDEDGKKKWNYHMAFLKRRKAYIYIDKRRYSEARQLLEEMINDPLSKDFAEGELKYLDANGLK
jgi:tetratricopeptide (TPR) repeat protein